VHAPHAAEGVTHPESLRQQGPQRQGRVELTRPKNTLESAAADIETGKAATEGAAAQDASSGAP
jgi:hypothetical protein